jgi:hypothetical protein
LSCFTPVDASGRDAFVAKRQCAPSCLVICRGDVFQNLRSRRSTLGSAGAGGGDVMVPDGPIRQIPKSPTIAQKARMLVTMTA